MPYDITQCYLPPDRADIPAFIPAEAGTRLSDPGGMEGWVDLVGLLHTEMVYLLRSRRVRREKWRSLVASFARQHLEIQQAEVKTSQCLSSSSTVSNLADWQMLSDPYWRRSEQRTILMSQFHDINTTNASRNKEEQIRYQWTGSK